MMYNILPGLTNSKISGWKDKVGEIDKLGIKEIALFPTNLELAERKLLYSLLEKTNLEKIPHVHLRHDMNEWEINFLRDKYKTVALNTHPSKDVITNVDIFQKYSSIIFIENLHFLPTEDELSASGGICLDVSHWEDALLNGDKKYDDRMRKLLSSNKVGCAHVSAVCSEPHIDVNPKYPNRTEYAEHIYSKMEEFNYIKKYINFLPEIISIELEDSFSKQLEVIEYLKKIIK